MRISGKWALALAVVVVGGSSVEAAKRLVPEGGAIQIMLLRQKSVQKELKLSEDKVKKIHDFANEQHKKALKVIKLDAAERDEKFAKMSEQNDNFIKENLDEKQQKRLHQITLQVTGLAWLTYSDVANKLELTAEQKKQLEQEQRKSQNELEEILYSTSPAKRKEKHQEHRQTCAERVAKVLTPAQQEKLKELKGKPFTGEIHIAYPKKKKPQE